jgi:hypothetical protein
MKISPRHVGLLAIGVLMGGTITVSFRSDSRRTVPAPASTTVSTGPIYAMASPPLPLAGTNILLRGPVDFESAPDFLENFEPSTRQDLIDTRYEPDFKLDDLK